MIDTTIIICTYTENRWDDIVAAVESCRQQQPPPGEIVLVADHNPKLYQRMTEYFSDLVVVENTGKQGLSGARNSGIAASRGRLIAFLDDDAVAEPDWLAKLQTHCEQANVNGAGGKVEPMWIGQRPGWFPDEFLWVVGCTYRGTPTKASAMRNLMGGCMLVRREVYDTVGGFRLEIGRIGTIPLGCEETELCIRANQSMPGRVFMYEPAARIHHKVPAARVTWKYFRSRCYAEGLSKALVSTMVGANDGLSSERTYTMKTLPMGVLRGLGDTLRGDFSGFGRAAAIVIGLLTTVTGYLVGRFYLRNKPAHNPVLETAAMLLMVLMNLNLLELF